MSFDSRIGLAGLLMALIGVAVAYLWPDKKWIGWACFCMAGILVIGWLTLEMRYYLRDSRSSFWLSVGLGCVVGGVLAGIIWVSVAATRNEDPQFTEIYGVYADRLGKALHSVETVQRPNGVYEAWYQNAIVLWVDNRKEFYQLSTKGQRGWKRVGGDTPCNSHLSLD